MCLLRFSGPHHPWEPSPLYSSAATMSDLVLSPCGFTISHKLTLFSQHFWTPGQGTWLSEWLPKNMNNTTGSCGKVSFLWDNIWLIGERRHEDEVLPFLRLSQGITSPYCVFGDVLYGQVVAPVKRDWLFLFKACHEVVVSQQASPFLMPFPPVLLLWDTSQVKHQHLILASGSVF